MANLLTPDIIKSFKVGVTFTDKESLITSTDFSIDGKYMVSANEAEQIVWMDCLSGREKQVINSHKYGVGLVKYTHGKTAVLHTSTKVNNDIRLVDVEHQSYHRYFNGHERNVTSLSISSSQDIFASACEDKTVKIWDFRKESCQGQLHVNIAQPVVSFEPNGQMFSVGFENDSISMYDIRSYKSNKPVKKQALEKEKGRVPRDLKYSKDGTKMLVTTNGSVIMLYDASTGNPLSNLTGFLNNEKVTMEASFTPDSKFIVSGSTDGFIHFWSTNDSLKVTKLKGVHTDPIRFVKFNPKYMMFASSSKTTAFWLPDQQSS